MLESEIENAEKIKLKKNWVLKQTLCKINTQKFGMFENDKQLLHNAL